MHVAGPKHGKTRTSTGKSRLVLVSLVTGRESGARFFGQTKTVAMQDQGNCEITFSTIENRSNNVNEVACRT